MIILFWPKVLKITQKTKGFQRDVEALAHSYKIQNMPVPSLEQLQSEAISEMRECLANMMAYRNAKHL